MRVLHKIDRIAQTVKIDEISFVVQGELNNEITPLTIASIRKNFPSAEIILSTYIGSDASGLDYDKIAFVEDPGGFPYNDKPDSKLNNVNRHIHTTITGFLASTRKYIFKLRTDFVPNGCDFLDFFDQFPKFDPEYKIFRHKVLSSVFFARDPRSKKLPLAFHPSDIAFFGLREDLINLFEIPLVTKEESVYCNSNGITQNRYVPEQHLWVNCLRKNGKAIVFDHQGWTSEQIVEDTEKYFVSNFIFLDWKQFCLTPPKKLTNILNNEFDSCITHIEWQKIYKRYLDNELIVPEIDPMRNFICRQERKKKLCQIIANICSMWFFGKSLKHFRRNLRKQIISWLLK
jgi:hypothetical protein